MMGIVEVLGRLRRLLHIRADLTKRFGELKPDVFVGIDAPDFNITLEGNLKKAGYQNHSLRQSIRLGVATETRFQNRQSHRSGARISAFRKAFYDKYNVPCRFIGHTMADAMPLDPDKNGARDVLGSSRCPLSGIVAGQPWCGSRNA